MRPTAKEISNVIDGWTCLKFFPSAPGAMRPIGELLADLVGTREQLQWLDSAMLNQVGEWPGPAEVRAIFCTRFKPADGIEGKNGYSAIAGFTPGDIESEKLIEHSQWKKLDEGKPRTNALQPASAVKLLGPAEPEAEPPVSDEERASIDELAAKLEARAARTAAEKQSRLTQRARRREVVETTV